MRDTASAQGVSRGRGAVAARRARLLTLAGCVLTGAAACDEAGPESPSVPVNEVAYGTDGTDGPFGAAALADGGFVVAGLTEGRIAPADGTIGFPMVLRVGASGRVEDTSVYRDIGYGRAMGVVPFADGLAVLVNHGIQVPRTGGGHNITVYRTRLDGRRQEVLFHLSEAFLRGRSLLRTDDGGLVIVLNRTGRDGNDLVKLDRAGTLLWTYRMPQVQHVVSAAEAPNGDLFVLGLDSDHDQLARLRPDGRERWRRTYGDETLWDPTVVVAAGNGAAVLGRRREPDPGVESVVVTRLDSVGELEWKHKYATGQVYENAMAALEEGGIVFGYSEAYRDGSLGHRRSNVVRISPDGEERWRRPFGPSMGTTRTQSIISLTDGRVAVVGWTGPERLGGYGGDDFDLLAVFYEPD